MKELDTTLVLKGAHATTFTEMEDAPARNYQPRIVLVDDKNRIRQRGVGEVAGPLRRNEAGSLHEDR